MAWREQRKHSDKLREAAKMIQEFLLCRAFGAELA
jgi:hypothetical protein